MIRYAVIEDEEYMRERLIRTVAKLRPEMTLVFESASVKESTDYFSTLPEVDVIFMDIELSDGNCFEIFDKVNVNVPIIFTTAYNEFALQAFEVFSLDYLLKPISDADLLKAIEKFEKVTMRDRRDWQTLNSSLSRQMKAGGERLLIVSGDTFNYINISEVAFFEADGGYIFAVLNDGKRRMTNFSNLMEVMEKVSGDSFFQISRKVIINIEALVKVSKYFRGRLLVRYRAGEEEYSETVSSVRKDEFLNWLGH